MVYENKRTLEYDKVLARKINKKIKKRFRGKKAEIEKLVADMLTEYDAELV